MVEVSLFTRIKKWFSFNRLAILQEHYTAVKHNARPLNAKEREEFEFFTKEFERYYNKANRLAFYRALLYIFLYATIAVGVIKAIPILNFLVPFIELGSALAGGGIAVVLIFLFTTKINMHIQRMQGCMYHLVAFYHNNPKRDTTGALKRMARVI